MDKWYEENLNNSNILSSRVRLARNFIKHIFPALASENQRISIIEDMAKALSSYKDNDSLQMIRMDIMDNNNKYSLIDKHLISRALAIEKKPSCAFISGSEKLSVMVMEEDHVRIQVIEAGDGIDKAYAYASLVDDMIDENFEYAFDENWGYLTSCPTNSGTGLRSSFMLHIPYLEMNGQIGNIARSISKFGYTLRGTFGEGSEPYGSVYQISNQVTLGPSEEEIINSIKSLTSEIIQKERSLMQRDLSENGLMLVDRVYRAYGTLTNARFISEKEAINNLSVLKTGIIGGVFDKELPNIYSLIINIRTATLAKNLGIADIREVPVKRAEYLRNNLA